MNEFGNFLYELRKEKGMTQAQLADRLGVTNKAVSKWETGEAMPETALLVPISEIFGVTVDELLNGRRSEEKDFYGEEPKEEPAEDFREFLEGHLFKRGKEDEETFLDKVSGAFCAALMLCGVAAYLCLGCFASLWHPYWVIVPACALCCGIIGILFHMFDGVKTRREREEGKNPYTGGICGILILASIIAYLLCGAFASLWHPYWIIIVLGVCVGSVIAAVGNCFSRRRDR